MKARATGSIYHLRFPVCLMALACILTPACASSPRIGLSSGVTTSRFNTTELIARVKTALLNDEVVGARRIDVQAIDGNVTLVGRVASAEERDRAVRLTRAVEGVWSVTSELRIEPD